MLDYTVKEATSSACCQFGVVPEDCALLELYNIPGCKNLSVFYHIVSVSSELSVDIFFLF